MEKGFHHQFHTFDSGLRLVTVPMPSSRSAIVLVLVGTGSKYETKNINGISHFLEHMMFKGTTKRPGKLDIARELEAIGAEYNAFTSKEYTGYYAKASAEKLDVIMDVVFDIFLNSKLAEEDINIERGVIVEEINMYRDEPRRYVGDLFEKLLYGDQPAGWEIAGEKETVMRLAQQQFRDYFTTHYIASNTIIAVAGNVNPDAVRAATERFFANIRQATKVEKLPVTEHQTTPQLLVHQKATDQTHFILGFRAFDMHDKRKYPLGILANVLGGGMASRLFSEVRDKRGLAYYVRAGSDLFTDSGSFDIAAGVNSQKAHEAIQVSLAEVAKILRDGITAEELQQAKDRATGSMALALEHSDAVAEAYADPVLYENKILTPEEELAKLQAVTLDQVHAVAKDIFKNEGLNLALIGPFDDEAHFRDELHL